MEQMHATTIIAVKKDDSIAIAGDGQVTLENTIMKGTARKVRRLYDDKVLMGFAGSVADAQALSDKFESKLREAHGNLKRAVIEFAKEWRTDRVLRRLEALMIVGIEFRQEQAVGDDLGGIIATFRSNNMSGSGKLAREISECLLHDP